MSLTTTLTIKKNGKTATMSFITQQYVCGLYVAIYTKGQAIPEQTGASMTEYEYHRSLRDNAKKEKHITFIKDESDALNRKDVMAEQMKFAKQYAETNHWPWIETSRGVMFSEDGKISDTRANAVRAQPEWKACLEKLEW
jgi:hypothetical protein